MKQSSKRSRFQPVEIGKVDDVRTVLESIPEEMTAFGGAPMLAEVEKRVGLVRELSTRIHDERKQNLVDHEGFDILLQRACQIGKGWADGNDCDWLRSDIGILLGLGRDPANARPGASQETVSRFEGKAVDKTNAKAVRELFTDHFINSHRRPPKEIELDCDGTIIKTYGAQEGAVYRGGRYKHAIYFPLKIFCGDWLMATVLRRGDQSESKTILTELKMVVGKLRNKWRRIRIKVRMDAAFGSPELYNWLRKERIKYEIALRSNRVLDLYSKGFVDDAETKFREQYGEPRYTGKDGGRLAQEDHAHIRGLPTNQRMEEEEKLRARRVRMVGEFSYKPDHWLRWERVICRVDFTDKGPELRYVMVSWQYGIPKKIYEEDYCQRGFAEQCIGRFKQTAYRLSAQEFYANQFRLIMYGIAYMLLMHLRNYASRKLRRCDVNTIRKTLLLMPMKVLRTKKKIVLQVSETHIHCREFFETWRRLAAA